MKKIANKGVSILCHVVRRLVYSCLCLSQVRCSSAIMPKVNFIDMVNSSIFGLWFSVIKMYQLVVQAFHW